MDSSHSNNRNYLSCYHIVNHPFGSPGFVAVILFLFRFLSCRPALHARYVSISKITSRLIRKHHFLFFSSHLSPAICSSIVEPFK